MNGDSVYVGGHWMKPESGQTLEMIAPSTGKQIGTIARGGAPEIDAAVKAARCAFEGVWGQMPAVDRGRLLTKLSEKILEHEDELTEIEANDTGKTLKRARDDVKAAARYFEFYAGAADKIHGDTIPFMPGHQVMILREARGVTGHIIPWNYPAQMFGRALGPALAAGNAAILKPAEEACLSCIRLTELAAEVGFPDGAINVVPGLGEEAGAALSAHPDIDLISFTGSPEVGTLIQNAAAVNHVPCILELGGKSPQIVFSDADQAKAIESIVGAIVQNTGQTCSAGSRVLIERSIYDEFMGALTKRFKQLRAGSHELDLDCGPVISKVQLERVLGFLERAKKDGIEIGAEGELDVSASKEGFFVTPTLFRLVPREHELAKEEVFGPVLSAIPFDDETDAIRLANGTDYGLIAGIWTDSGARQMRLAKAVRAGQVYINGYGAGGGIELPFGGFKKSGHGREKGLEALKEFTVSKTVVFNHG
ncbi:aldehyde dehydrogenase family protein [Franzmannia qiaohouensis]|uniref:Aldehyde dehydrogenase family protein n=1 Tax=Franzmannia qiaohouensis TaxID=1329370 RepID=A0ABU1HL39_9GAMM|nr:aldehyde dehydrogenase family protein [Halomonas qiaohouensis]MDR5907519.1 aldehyde dehydrogenase family protein [Halomonas qiaohouensis]